MGPAQKKKEKKLTLAQAVAAVPHLLYDVLFFTFACWMWLQRCLFQ